MNGGLRRTRGGKLVLSLMLALSSGRLQAQECDEASAQALVSKGIAAFRSGHVDEAQDRLTEAFESCADAEIARKKAFIFYKTGLYSDCESWASKALSIAPEFGDAHLSLARCQLAQSKVDSASASFRSAVYFDGQNPKKHQALFMFCSTQGDVDCARTAFREMIRLQPAMAEEGVNHLLVATAFFNGGAFEEAKTALTEAERLQADPRYVILLKGQLMLADHRVEAARQSLGTAANGNALPFGDEAALIVALELADDLDTAQKVYDRHLAEYPDDRKQLEHAILEERQRMKKLLASVIEQSDSSDAETAVRKAFAEFVAALQSADFEAYARLKAGGADPVRFRANSAAAQALDLHFAIESIEVDGDSASVRFTIARPDRKTPERESLGLVRQDGRWLIASD